MAKEVLIKGGRPPATEGPKKSPLLLDGAKIFESEGSVSFSEYGSKLCGLVQRLEAYTDTDSKTRPSPERLAELKEEIYRGCGELGIDPKRLQEMGQELSNLISQREQLIRERFPLSSKKKRFTIILKPLTNLLRLPTIINR